MGNVISLRRQLHKIPELAFKEYSTKKFIKNFAQKECHNFKIIYDDIGGLVFVKKGTTNENILWRADIDALPITEQNNSFFKSRNIGISHTCGHDSHMAILLSTMKEINEKNNTRSIYCVFQAGEEGVCGSKFIVDFLLDKSLVFKFSFASHVNPLLDQGRISSKSSEILSASKTMVLNIKLSGGHIEPRTDPLYHLYQIINKYNYDNVITKISSINSNGYINILYTDMRLIITQRSYDEKIWGIFLNELTSYLKNEKIIINSNIKILPKYEVVSNSKKGVDLLRKCSKQVKNIEYETCEKSFSSDDFFNYSLVSDNICYFYFGVKGNIEPFPCHSEHFFIEETTLPKIVELSKKIFLQK